MALSDDLRKRMAEAVVSRGLSRNAAVGRFCGAENLRPAHERRPVPGMGGEMSGSQHRLARHIVGRSRVGAAPGDPASGPAGGCFVLSPCRADAWLLL
jgi:hypothetical protein